MRFVFVFALSSAAVLLVACGASELPIVVPTCSTIGTSVRPATATVHPGDTLSVTASVACVASANATFTWTSSDTSIAVVDASTGLVQARGTGTTTIVATLTSDQTQKGAMAVRVIP